MTTGKRELLSRWENEEQAARERNRHIINAYSSAYRFTAIGPCEVNEDLPTVPSK